MPRFLGKTLRWMLIVFSVTIVLLSNSHYMQARSAEVIATDPATGNPGVDETLPNETEPVETEVPGAGAPGTGAPGTSAPGTSAPGTSVPSETEAPTTGKPTETVSPTTAKPTIPAGTTSPAASKPAVTLPAKDLSLSQINILLKGLGKMLTPGMKSAEYEYVMSREWVDAKDYDNPPVTVDIDLNEKIDNEKYYDLLKKLSRFDGVYLYKIGETSRGSPIYSISIDFESDNEKEVYMFTGQVHAREFAGGVFILKMFAELIQKAQTDAETQELLKKVKYVAVPIINLDARQKIIDGDPAFVGNTNNMWKENIEGVDINRNFPGLNAGLLASGLKPANTTEMSIKARGSYFGSAKETQAMMKWLHHYIIEEKAVYLVDMHQQGRVMFSGKPWDNSAGEMRSKRIVNSVLNYLNRGNTEKYYYIPESLNYGLKGEGSSITDYAMSLALGANYSQAYGIMTYADQKGKEYTLLHIRDLEKSTVKLTKANSRFAASTFEIGTGTNALGYTNAARSLMATEYLKYHYSGLLEVLPGLVN